MKIPVLTYHSTNISGNEYHNNDHIALNEDLNLIHKLGIEVISAIKLVQWIKGELQLSSSQKYVVITFDDGCELDYMDWEHPTFGFQKSFLNILKSYKSNIHATSFVIASPNARKTLERTCLDGNEIWGDDWWQQAEDSQLMSIENHSWDHLHVTLDKVMQVENKKGNFELIETLSDADAQVKQASEYIHTKVCNKQIKLFAYPYGDYNKYLSEEYFPNKQDTIQAAFTCDANSVNKECNVWKIPRFVCGMNWSNSKELENILL